ncbi:hypothetical protein MRX96_025119 [Rhipicephalus microplus]
MMYPVRRKKSRIRAVRALETLRGEEESHLTRPSATCGVHRTRHPMSDSIGGQVTISDNTCQTPRLKLCRKRQLSRST